MRLKMDRHPLLLIMQYKVSWGTDTSSMQGCLQVKPVLPSHPDSFDSDNGFPLIRRQPLLRDCQSSEVCPGKKQEMSLRPCQDAEEKQKIYFCRTAISGMRHGNLEIASPPGLSHMLPRPGQFYTYEVLNLKYKWRPIMKSTFKYQRMHHRRRRWAA